MIEQIYTKRGNLAAKAGERQPKVGSVLRVSLFWLGREPLTMDKEYILKLGTDRVSIRLLDTIKVIDASNLHNDGMKKMAERNDVAECILATKRPYSIRSCRTLSTDKSFCHCGQLRNCRRRYNS